MHRAPLRGLEASEGRHGHAGAVLVAGAALSEGLAVAVARLVVVARLRRDAALYGIGIHARVVAAVAGASVAAVNHVLHREEQVVVGGGVVREDAEAIGERRCRSVCPARAAVLRN